MRESVRWKRPIFTHGPGYNLGRGTRNWPTTAPVTGFLANRSAKTRPGFNSYTAPSAGKKYRIVRPIRLRRRWMPWVRRSSPRA